jgi:hypothetical protein
MEIHHRITQRARKTGGKPIIKVERKPLNYF